MPLILGANSVSGGYEVDNSLRFNSGSSDSLNRTYGTPTDAKKGTWSMWIKKSTIGTTQFILGDSGEAGIRIDAGNGDIEFWNTSGVAVFFGTPFFRDISAWYHLVVVADTTQATNANRLKLYINGSQITFSTTNTITQNSDFPLCVSGAKYIGRQFTNGYYYNGYLSETYFVDGQALTPSSFGETDQDTNIWKPIPYTGSFGTNGFYLEFKDSSALGDDTSGNGNDFTVNNLTSVDQSTDTCTNNFCTLNPLSKGTITLAEGNLQWQGDGDNGGKGTFLITKGKWYWEMTRADAQNNVGLGVAISNWTNTVDSASGEAWYGYQGQGYKISGTGGEVLYGTTFGNTDIVSVAFDADNGNLVFYVNGSSQGTAFTGLTNSEGYVPIYFTYRNSVTNYMNFGSPMNTISSGNADANGYGNFEYAVPAGYFALCTKNLAEYG